MLEAQVGDEVYLMKHIAKKKITQNGVTIDNKK